MKKRLFTFLLCVTILLTLSPIVSAAEEDSGFYRIGAAEGIEIRPISTYGEAISGISMDMDGDGEDDVFFPGSEALLVTLLDTAQGEMYLLTISSPEMTLYVDQQPGGGELSFLAAFKLPGSQTELMLEIGSTEAGFEKVAVTLFYTPSAPSASSAPSTPQEPGADPAPDQTEKPQTDTGPDQTTEPELKPGYSSCAKDHACPMRSFTDLEPAAWYHDGVHYVLENGIMNGVGNDLFNPDSPTSRGMIVTMLWRLEGMPHAEAAAFRDVLPGAWYAKAVDWAASKRIVEGYSSERFAPDDPISREQLAVILWRYAQVKGADRFSTGSMSLGIFIDAEHISTWALDGVQWALNVGLITGTGNERLSPKTDAARAQVATMLMRFSRMT